MSRYYFEKFLPMRAAQKSQNNPETSRSNFSEYIPKKQKIVFLLIHSQHLLRHQWVLQVKCKK